MPVFRGSEIEEEEEEEDDGKEDEKETFHKLLQQLAKEVFRISNENDRLHLENRGLQDLLGHGLSEAAQLKESEQPKDAMSEDSSLQSAELGIHPSQIPTFGRASAPRPPSSWRSNTHASVGAESHSCANSWPINKADPHFMGNSRPISRVQRRTIANSRLMNRVTAAEALPAAPLEPLAPPETPPELDVQEPAEEGLRSLKVGSRAVCPARAKILKEQFARLDRGDKGFISAQECWEVVSHFEHQMYGHSKHNRKRVVRAVRCAAAKYSDSETPAMCERGEWGLSFCALVLLMQEEDEEGKHHNRPTPLLMDGDGSPSAEGEYKWLRRAFEGEHTEHMTLVARGVIAHKQEMDNDPQPLGRLKVLLEQVPPVIIFLNAAVIGLQADIPHTTWEVLELFFLAFYISEFILKVRLLGCRRYFRGGDALWNLFDFSCIALSLMDLSFTVVRYVLGDDILSSDILGMLKVLRLARLARIVRSFRYKVFDDLKVMVLGVLSGARVLGWAIALFFICIFIIGVFMREIVGINEEEFRNVPSSMFSVFRCFTDGCAAYDGTPLHERLRQRYGAIFMVPFILMFLVITFGVFNLIIAVFIDNVVTTTVKRKQTDLGARESEMKTSIEEMLVSLIRNTTSPNRKPTHASSASYVLNAGNSKATLLLRSKTSAEAMAEVRKEKVSISRELFNTWLLDPDMLALLEEVDIDTATKSEIFDVCDVDKSGSLTPDELVSGLMRLRGPISKCDVIAIRLKVRYLTQMLEDIHHLLGA